MDPARKVPQFDPSEVLAVVRKHIVLKPPERGGNRVRHAVDALLQIPAVQKYLKGKHERQRNAFATHASRYFELYLPNGAVEIAHTTRYRHKTGKSELCIIATRALAVGSVITDLKGSLADLTPEEDEALRKKGRETGIRKDFSVIYSRQKNTSHLFLGPARFVNHDCKHNVQLFRDGRYITFRVIKPIEQGQEITAHYGNSYFGRKNKDCLCETCEKAGKGAYAPRVEGVDDVSESDISESSEIDRSRRFWDKAEVRSGVFFFLRSPFCSLFALPLFLYDFVTARSYALLALQLEVDALSVPAHSSFCDQC
ncbi:SET domain-containing protein [Exidia glandulosa HHB12029]|uniref:SET domain-containing protein n=1 Tax=Exidia glandulosa HHB12029 TaxID=1314781 RepID=A0A165LZF9_EXIGL|nr:SET domain-containing protein [Exidia glandulosa HHB12029]